VEQSKRVEIIPKGECQIRDSGAIDKGVRNILGRGGAIIGRFRVGHFSDFAKKKPRE
jgi:hypothetical protein